jgi:hypothetical protein
VTEPTVKSISKWVRPSLRRPACHAKAVVGVLKLRRDAAARRASRDLDVMAPGSAARRFARGLVLTARIALRRTRVVSGIVAVGTPFVDVLAHGIEAKSVGRRGIDRGAMREARCPRETARRPGRRTRRAPIQPRWAVESRGRAIGRKPRPRANWGPQPGLVNAKSPAGPRTSSGGDRWRRGISHTRRWSPVFAPSEMNPPKCVGAVVRRLGRCHRRRRAKTSPRGL